MNGHNNIHPEFTGFDNENAYKVIDADRNLVIQMFSENNRDLLLEEYRNQGIWDDVSVDRDGDIILWKS